MNPDDIKLENLSKDLEYTKFARNMDAIRDLDQIRSFAKYFAKLYLKQQEVTAEIAKMGIDV